MKKNKVVAKTIFNHLQMEDGRPSVMIESIYEREPDEIELGFGSRLREERERKGLTQDEFARLGGVQKLSQHRYEKGLSEPAIGYLYALASYGVDITYLLSGGRSAAVDLDVDIEFMRKILTNLDDSLIRLGVTVSTNKKAHIVAMLHQTFKGQKRVDISTVDAVVKIASKNDAA
jgi:transcriptional regulator with XRE-family HTH domain